MKLWDREYSHSEVLRRMGAIHQLASVSEFELAGGRAQGVQALHVRNAAGLAFDVLAGRGMGIGDLSFQGIPLSFRTAAEIAHAAYFQPSTSGWLSTWPGGFMTPCGLSQVGSPCIDKGEELSQHGLVTSFSATHVNYGGMWDGDEYELFVSGEVHEAVAFRYHLALQRRYRIPAAQARLIIEDRVENRSHQTVPHMILYHFNLGFPLLGPSARLELPEHHTVPRDDDAAAGLAACLEFSEPISGYREQVFYHDVEPGPDGRVEVSLANPDFNHGRGLRVTWRYSKETLPVLVEWKMMGEGMYVVGVEPANCHVEGRCRERERGTLVMLEPGETRDYSIEITIE